MDGWMDRYMDHLREGTLYAFIGLITIKQTVSYNLLINKPFLISS